MSTDSQKEEALRKANESKAKRVQIKKARRSLVKDVPFRPDTGANDNVISRNVVKEMQESGSDVKMDKLKTSMNIELADGREVICTERCKVNVQLVTVAGPVNLIDLQCLVLEKGSDEFLLGDPTLKVLMLATCWSNLPPTEQLQEDDDVPKDDIVGLYYEEVEEIRSIVSDLNLWRAKLGADPPAKLGPLRVVLIDDAIRFRSKNRQYSPIKSKFLREYGVQSEKF
ncbi:hypothetical protein PsorP6_016614 [Peronosclerospora sorghi]|uniref:Uncharacterized protein n=1 Tax=Peronosclerospora sorghi TaxID=230839 RepID=A0ACC0VMP7_9STRA|nr:hypothetical protein PsorP6_016614 [Peronosclerospora sorghi]